MLQSVLSNPEAGQALRRHYARRAGGEHIEFLIASSNFDRSRNALQRFEQLRHIIHRFVHAEAERPIAIADERRAQLLDEWRKWSTRGNRVPADAVLPALKAVTEELMSAEERLSAPNRPSRT